MCEGPEAGKSWVFIGNKEKQYGHSPGKGKISRWKVSSDQIVQFLEGPGELSQLNAEPMGSPEVQLPWGEWVERARGQVLG